ncbi:4-hydroxy-tetrahydrodipicolinate reductase [Pseudobdellovibrio exovorus]|uniref:4-hydroxy-tetrahydrodipicolinate reductase n=1 Tax=Pseudobdellovibrio exovorus JSS TaxID=1184267 RepID=M4VAG3_9BACT|nr:dihydrodipicolinate reductase C-terminal domain-containing protein [Pseudobdellovibrio exovorus]AGH95460.1 hypothetical protein A11Q_1244 [Pseudobdellovibrio exovorus JSS]
MAIKIGLFGFGRTGSAVAKEIVSDENFSLEWVCRKTIQPNSNYASHSLGFDQSFAPFVAYENLTADFLKKNPVDIVIDFSSTTACQIYEMLVEHGIRVVTAISKYSPEDLKLLERASLKGSILYSPNITLGINWLMIASKILKKIVPHADIEIVEEHFRSKSEVSGTALRLADHLELEPRKHVNSIRVGGIVGRHEVIFGLPNQTIRLSHESINRAAFGAGAIFASKWLHNKPEGFYTMEQAIHEKFITQLGDLKFEAGA